MSMNKILEAIKGGLLVSCQALETEPLHSSYIMQRMAVAARRGGAVGIRANTVPDILKIKEAVELPLIGIIKRVYEGSDVFITPTMKEVDELMSASPEIIALDATIRRRPGNVKLETLVKEIREKYPEQMLMADCSSIEEGMQAAELGFDVIGTTLSGYTEYTRGTVLPNFDMIRCLARETGKPVIAEGGIWTPEHLKEVLDAGAWAAVVGTAITRPMDITKRFVSILQK